MAWCQGEAYGQDLPDRVFALFDVGMSTGEVSEQLLVSSSYVSSEQLLVSSSYVSKVLRRRRSTGELSTRAKRCQVLLKLAALHEAFAAEFAAKPHATIDELRRWLTAAHGLSATKGLMVKILASLNLTH